MGFTARLLITCMELLARMQLHIHAIYPVARKLLCNYMCAMVDFTVIVDYYSNSFKNARSQLLVTTATISPLTKAPKQHPGDYHASSTTTARRSLHPQLSCMPATLSSLHTMVKTRGLDNNIALNDLRKSKRWTPSSQRFSHHATAPSQRLHHHVNFIWCSNTRYARLRLQG
jgi:hypothetical protein